MSSWYEQAAAKLKAEYSQVKGQKEQAMRSAVRDVLLEFCPRTRNLPRRWSRAARLRRV